MSETASTSTINLVLESVMDLIDALNLYDSVSRGALGTGSDLCCELSPSVPDELYMNKAIRVSLDLTINGKHSNLQTLSDDLNILHHALTSRTEYPYGTGWKIIDIRSGALPQVIGREDNNDWIMASDLLIVVYLDAYSPPEPTPDPVPDPTPEEPAEENNE